MAGMVVVSTGHIHGKVYSIQHYVMKFVSDLVQVGGFLRLLRTMKQERQPIRHTGTIKIPKGYGAYQTDRQNL
jgi:predicted aconitase